jgi:hypothetical protein
MSTHLALGAVGALAGLAALSSRKGSPAYRRGLGRFGGVTKRARGLIERPGLMEPGYFDDLAWNLDVVERLYPRVRHAYPRRVLDLVERQEAGGWYSPEVSTLRLTHHPDAPGFISHQSMHMLDYSENRWLSAIEGTPARRLTDKATELARPHLEAYIEDRVQARLAKLSPRVQRLLSRGQASWDDVHSVLVQELRATNTVEDIQVALESARGAFGFDFQAAESALWEDPMLVEALRVLLPFNPGGGVPFSILGKPKHVQDAYFRSYDVNRMRRALKGYTFARYEVFARLMDQVLGEEALRRGTPIRRKERVRLDDIPLELLPEIEDDAWATARQMGWTQ